MERMLKTTGTAAQETLISAMLEWWMASDRDDALSQIVAAPGKDLAGIKNSVIAGLASLAESLEVKLEDLLSEERLVVLSDAMASDVVKALDAIHLQWIEDNFTARRWAEKFFKGQLGQYRKTAKLPWSEVEKDLLFIKEYLKEYRSFDDDDLQESFEEYAEVNSSDDDLEAIASKASSFAPEIIDWIVKFRDNLDPVKKAELITEINDFLSKHQDGAEIMKIMIEAVSK